MKNILILLAVGTILLASAFTAAKKIHRRRNNRMILRKMRLANRSPSFTTRSHNRSGYFLPKTDLGYWRW